ncbi:hypothetical protein V8C35DRAFT_54548 [Trichoderma chlorosporum]
MATPDKCFSFSISPPAGKPAKLFFLGPGSDICNVGRLGLNGDCPRLSSQAIFSREPSADSTVSAASVAVVCDGDAAVACGCDIASAASHHGCHDIHGSAEERPGARRFAASHPGSWATTITDAPSNAATGCTAKSLTKAPAVPNLSWKDSKEEKKEEQHRERDACAEMALQKTQCSQASFLPDQELLTAEVKGIYAGLVMVETKCIEVDNAQTTQREHECSEVDNTFITQDAPIIALNNSSKWQALIALHRTLLHEHHDFFLASQHPTANPSPRRLAAKYAMPARMWLHGIHSFLELLRYSLPDLMEHMITFIYMAYTMMALFNETVPVPADTWI